ncbi:DUF169 domain-containing protein [Trichlorobacter ammonificans]|uniref:DUF169 domain-containing protein n=1 Tax=Trichlorobacter ammonificans TaxID=2916410 RepID=A0ABM9D6V2_9BACT|nr:DUF169 domain-containing protein [Trichlorobacter ammonificans]CAH2030105.1 conserved protein of unknown function [Trichlorobacter ammonificans]
MQSAIATAIGLASEPVALLLTDEKPEGALQFDEGKWGCVVSMFGAAATKGKIAVFDSRSYGCFGGGVALGFGNTYRQFPGSMQGFCNFLSSGNEGWEPGEAIAAGMEAGGARKEFVQHFLHGERYKQSPELVRQFVEELPMTEVASRYVAFVPFNRLEPGQGEPASVTMLVTSDQLAALVVLANYDRPGLENVAIPYVAGCQSIGILSYREAQREQPRCIAGLMDLSARAYLRSQTGRDVLTFTMPYRRFLEMEACVAGSFLEQHPWLTLKGEA